MKSLWEKWTQCSFFSSLPPLLQDTAVAVKSQCSPLLHGHSGKATTLNSGFIALQVSKKTLPPPPGIHSPCSLPGAMKYSFLYFLTNSHTESILNLSVVLFSHCNQRGQCLCPCGAQTQQHCCQEHWDMLWLSAGAGDAAGAACRPQAALYSELSVINNCPAVADGLQYFSGLNKPLNKQRLRELGVFNTEKGELWGDLVAALQY